MSTVRDSLYLVTDVRNLDESVQEVFGTMLDVACRNEPEESDLENRNAESLTAVVGFGGVLTGACVFRCEASGAMAIAGRMTGMELSSVDDVVKDGIGEICNMLAGTWKSKVPILTANCSLSVPAVITGKDYKLHVQAPEFRISRSYEFEGVRFDMTIVCDGLQ